MFKAQNTKIKLICIFKQQPQKSYEQDILPKNLKIDLVFFASYGTYFMYYFICVLHSLRSRRLEVAGERENGRARETRKG